PNLTVPTPMCRLDGSTPAAMDTYHASQSGEQTMTVFERQPHVCTNVFDPLDYVSFVSSKIGLMVVIRVRQANARLGCKTGSLSFRNRSLFISQGLYR